ncbi:MAG: DUF2804 family protein [Actinobacteria bacterium]|nr:DUF2804 family protein [Actinomycetota bacterium]
MANEGLPWRGPGADRPALPLPPGPMPVWRDGAMRKRWRYVGFYGERLMLCAAHAEVGPTGQCFWALWDRGRATELDRTSLRPGSREVVLDGSRLVIDAPGLHADLRLGEAEAIESICPSGEGAGWGWTRKRAGVPIEGVVETPGLRAPVAGFGVDDESAGYQARHTSWHWSAGVGTAADGRAVAWNLVEGINDPLERSERAIWVEGIPREPAPVRFAGLDGVRFAEGSRLDFEAGAERARDDNFLLVRSTYRHRFGTFTGRLDGIELGEGRGVMESHDALW